MNLKSSQCDVNQACCFVLDDAELLVLLALHPSGQVERIPSHTELFLINDESYATGDLI